MSDTVYLDHNATTPVHPEVVDAMLPFLRNGYGNPSSAHALGRVASKAVQRARAQVASLIGANQREIVFTSGGTESNNWVLLAPRAPAGRLVRTAIEHPAITAPAEVLRTKGWTVDVLPINGAGFVDLDAARSVLAEPATVVSVMRAHNETGAVQPLAALAGLARAAHADVHIHTDAAQAVGKIPVDVRALDVDLLTLAGHKLYAPKGIGALYIREGIELAPLLHGGGQQAGRRPGTEAVPNIVGLGAACERAERELATEATRLATLRERLWTALSGEIPDIHRTLPRVTPCLPNTLHVCIPGVDGARVLAACPTVAASTGSACHAGDDTVPGVLGAMGLGADVARGALRFSLGAQSDGRSIDAAARDIIAAWRTTRSD